MELIGSIPQLVMERRQRLSQWYLPRAAGGDEFQEFVADGDKIFHLLNEHRQRDVELRQLFLDERDDVFLPGLYPVFLLALQVFRPDLPHRFPRYEIDVRVAFLLGRFRHFFLNLHSRQTGRQIIMFRSTGLLHFEQRNQ